MRVTADPAKELTLYFRINRDGSITFNFGIILSGYTVVVNFKTRKGDSVNLLQLTSSSGLTVGSTSILLTMTKANAALFLAQTYFWEMVRTKSGLEKDWLTGDAVFHNGKFDGVESDSETVTILENGSTVDITINDSSIASAFTDLTDVPNSYSGQTLKYVRVNAGETGLEFTSSAVFTLTNGNGTTANGTAVDLGGTMTGNVDITGSNDITFGSGPFNGIGDFTIWTSGTFRLYSDALATQIEISDAGVGIQATLTTLGDTRLSPFISGSGGSYYNITGGSIAADREVQIPNLSASDFFVVLNTAQTFGAKQTFFTSSISSASINIPPGVAPSSPNAGDVWTTTTHLFARLNGVTYQIDQQTTAGAALTNVDDTNVTLTLGGTPAMALLQASSLTLGWTGTLAYSRFVSGTGLSVVGRSATTSGVQADIVGTANQVLRVSGTTLGFGAVDLAAMVGSTVLPVANGGTNIASYAVGDILYASAGATLSKLADVAAGSYLRSGGVTTAPGWSTTTLPNSATTGDIIFASASSVYSNRAAVATGSVLGSAGISTAPAYLAVSNGLTATGSTLKFGGSLTAATNITGTSTNIFTLQFDALGTTITNGAGTYYKNTTAAAAGAQQISPIITLEGQGWKTTATAASQAVAFSMYSLPVQGTANPTGELVFSSSINGGAQSILGKFSTLIGAFAVGNPGGGSGYIQMAPGDASNTGQISWYNPSNSRVAYLGFNTAGYLGFTLTSTSIYVSGGNLILGATTSTVAGTGNLVLGTAGNKIYIKEGTGGSLGQTTLVSGTKAITISGLTTSSRAIVTLVIPSGVTLTTTYQAVCTANTLTIQANVAAGTINTVDGSTLNYLIIEPTP